MKTVFVLFSVFVFSCSLIAQPVFKKQISFLDFDARNPSFIETSVYGFYPFWFNSPNVLLFEGYQDSAKPQIFILKYDLEKDSFFATAQITFSKGSCVNPCGIISPIGNISEMDRIIWQTNENGTWDIAYGELIGDTLRNVRYIAHDSFLDETNPQLLIQGRQGYDFDFGITYEKGGSVYLYFEVDTLKVTERIFDADGVDSYEYQKASGILTMQFQNANYNGTVVAEKKFQNGTALAFYKTKDNNSGNWSEERYLYDSISVTQNPKLWEIWSDYFTTFETMQNGKRELKFFEYPQYLGHPDHVKNISDSTYETFNFSTKQIPFVGKSLSKSFYGYGNSMYQVIKDGKNYLYTSYSEHYDPFRDSLIDLMLNETIITTGNIGFIQEGLLSYSIWEDSSENGTIQLFGSSGAYPVGGIENETSPQDFTLYQNYPNPFNPETVISFQLSVRSNVSLKIFDVLGREVATLVNEEKPAGEYQVLFNNQLTTNHKIISSGVLFYQLKVGNRLQTKSMLLLK